MARNLDISPPRDASEIEAAKRLWVESFGSTPDWWSTYVSRIGSDNLRFARGDGGVHAALAIYKIGQWFGGRMLPMHGLAAVGTQLHRRGQGAANALVIETLREARAQGVALSALHPVSRTVYRKSGYELAGHRYSMAIPVNRLSLSAAPGGVTPSPATPLGAEDHELLVGLHRERCRRTNGQVERDDHLWQRLLAPVTGETVYAYLIGRPDQPEGYLLYQHASNPPHGYDVVVRDWVALTPGAHAQILRMLAQTSSIAHRALLVAPPNDPLFALLPERIAEVSKESEWFLRIVDVAGALAGRGYAAWIDAEVHLAVDDPTLPENTGAYLLRVKGGKAEVTRGGRGEVRLHVRALAALYSGYASAYDLQSLGWLKGEAPALAQLTAIMAGSTPHMADFF